MKKECKKIKVLENKVNDLKHGNSFIEYLKAHLEWEMSWPERMRVDKETAEKVILYYRENNSLVDSIEDFDDRLEKVYQYYYERKTV